MIEIIMIVMTLMMPRMEMAITIMIVIMMLPVILMQKCKFLNTEMTHCDDNGNCNDHKQGRAHATRYHSNYGQDTDILPCITVECRTRPV